MKRLDRYVLRALLATLVIVPGALRAQGGLPPAEELVSRHVQAIGGVEAYKKHKSMAMSLSWEMPAMGLKADMTVKQMQPNLVASQITIPGMGEILSGYNGKVAWAMDPMQGARLLEGAELQQTMDQSQWGYAVRSSELIEEMETVERTTMGGTECYKVRLVWKSGRESHDCYAVDTGLIVATIMEQVSQMGTIHTETLMSEYKEFGGVKMATRMSANMMGQPMLVQLNDIEFGTVSASDFELPAQIKALTEERGN